MKATVLVDNIGTEELPGEWGLSFFIEYRGVKVLLDAGADGLFAENALRLGLALDEVDHAVLSHAHYDHADGMADFLAQNTKAKLYLRESCGENCYKKEADSWKYIGIREGLLGQYRDRLVRVSGDLELEDGMWLVGHKTPGLEEAGKRERMYLREDDTCTVISPTNRALCLTPGTGWQCLTAAPTAGQTISSGKWRIHSRAGRSGQ